VFNPGIIEISTTNALAGTAFSSYIIEIWFFPDNIFDEPVKYNAPLGAPVNGINNIFYTNVFQIFADGNSTYDFYSIYINNTVKKSLVLGGVNMLSKNEWNRMFFEVKYDPSPILATNPYITNFYTKNKIGSSNAFSLGTSTTSLALTKIVFSHNDQTGKYPNVYWGSGYYRNLRIWNGDQISVYGIINYND